jgi:hypothetical protein
VVPLPSDLTPCTPLNLTYIWIVPSKLSLRSPPYTNSLYSTSKSHVHIPSLRSCIQRIHPGPSLCVTFRNRFVFYIEGLLAPCQTPKLQDHPLSFVCLFNIFAANPQCWRPSLLSATWGRTMLLSQGGPPNMGTYYPNRSKLLWRRFITYHIISYHRWQW